MGKRITDIVMLPNISKNIFGQRIESITGRFTELGCRVAVSPEYAREYGVPENCTEYDGKGCDAFLVLGGDGSMIEAAHYTMGTGIPVVGMNFGHLGYLTELAEGDEEELKKLVLGEYEVDERMMLTAEICDGYGNVRTSFTVLNDIVLTNGPVSRMISFDLYADGVKIQTLRADGLIAATPTGSTAYSLSAGGPLINPKVKVLLLTPICPHTFNARPMVMDEGDVIKIDIAALHQDIMVTFDGQESFRLQPGDAVIVRRAELPAQIVKFDDKNYYQTIRTKLLRNA